MLKGIRRFTKQFKHGEKGFTLIELLIAIAILGILIAVVVPNVANYLNSGKLTAANNEASMVQAASIAYQADNGGTAASGTDALSGYFVPAGAKVNGSYTINADGSIDCSAYPGIDAAIYHFDGVKWTK